MASSSRFGMLAALVVIAGAGTAALLSMHGSGKQGATPVAGSVLPIDTGIASSVNQVTFDHHEISEALQPNVWNVIFTPNDPTILSNLGFTEVITPGKDVFGYEYTSHDATTELAAKALHDAGQSNNFFNLFPGKFFASDYALANDPTLIAFRQRHPTAVIKSLANTFLDKNARYVVETTDTGATFTARDTPSDDCVPSPPTFAGWTGTNFDPYDMTISRNTAFVSFADGSIGFYDLSQSPWSPQSLGSFNPTGRPTRMAVQGNNLFITDGAAVGNTAGMQIFDTSTNPPTFVGKYDRQTAYSDQNSINTPYADIAVSGNYAYVTNGNHGFQVIDISNPAHPVLAASEEFGAAVNNGYMDRITIVGNTLYGWSGWGGDGIFHVFDITNPRHPVWKSVFLPPDASPPALSITGDLQTITFAGHFAYVAAHDMGVVGIVDVSDTSHPTLVGLYTSHRPRKSDGTDDFGNPSVPYDIAMTPIVIGHSLYVFSDPRAGNYAEVADIRHPTLPQFLSDAVLPAQGNASIGFDAISSDASYVYGVGQYLLYSAQLHCP